MNQLRRTSDNLAELDRLGSNRRTWAKAYNEPERGNEMDWEPTAKVSYNSAPNRPRGDKPQAKWVSREILEQRRDRQECLRCGDSNHFISKCCLAPATRPVSGKTKRQQPRTAAASETAPKPVRKAQKQKAVVEELSSDSGSESDSENE